MTKSQLIKALALQKKLSFNDAEKVVNTVFDAISESLENGKRVELRGFGSFGLKQRNPRDGRNPKTGESVAVEAKRVVFFKAGKELRERVDGPNDPA
ncbi:MAG: integration host factor subunit beta [Magnetococcales bacterium]|nr:integration host factor subunit beta [Magnetococcales bacterium]